jgi:PAS domain S-box-containing protein
VGSDRTLEDLYRLVVENSLDLITLIDQEARMLFVSPSWHTVLGYETRELLGTNGLDLVHPDDIARARAAIEQTLIAGGAFDVRVRLRRRDGAWLDFEGLGIRILDDDGQPLMLAAARDISKRVAAERERINTEARMTAVIESSLDCVIQMDHDGRITEFNRAAEETFGYGREEVVGRLMVDVIVPPSLRERHVRGLARYLETGEGPALSKRLELTGMRAGGEEFPVELSIHRVSLPGPPVFTGFVRDITERKQAEREREGLLLSVRRLNEDLELRVAERTSQLEDAIGELEAFSYSVSHDLRAPLRAIDGFSRILLRDHAPQLDEDARTLLETVRRSALHMGQMIDHLLDFARLGRLPISRQSVDVRSIVESCIEELRASMNGQRVEITLGALPEADGDPAMLRHVFLNLLDNAVKFTSRREIAHVEIGCLEGSRPPIYFVRDDGAGFEMDYANKLFGVFQRLHRRDEFDGTGVGLAVAHRMVHRHGGKIWAEGEVDRGATFYLTLDGEPTHG